MKRRTYGANRTWPACEIGPILGGVQVAARHGGRSGSGVHPGKTGARRTSGGSGLGDRVQPPITALSVPRLPGQARPAGPTAQDLSARERAHHQAGGAGGVLLRPDLLDRVRHRGDPAGGRARQRDRADAADLAGHRRPAAPAGDLLPPGDRCVPVGGRRIRGQPGQFRQRRGLGGRRRPADRLHPDGRGERVQRRGQHDLGVRPGQPPGAVAGRDRHRLHRAAGLGQPARHPRGWAHLRDPDLPVRGEHGRDGGHGDRPGADRQPRQRQLLSGRPGGPDRPRPGGRGGHAVPGAARLRLGHHRADGRGGRLQRGLGLPAPRGAQRQDEVPTVVAQLGQHVLGSSPLGHAFFLLTQGATLMILVLAANTSFSGFPLLASFAAGDALLPRQLRKRGHRLVYSNGILVLSAVASLLVMAFHASTSALIPLYAIGVVISFTLSQAGMTKRHWKVRERGWRYGLVVNGVGGLVTLVVLMVIVVAKFTAGAWMVCIAIPLLVIFLLRTQKAYRSEVRELKVEASQRLAPPKPRHEVVVLVEDLDQATLAALQYARQLNPLNITAVHIAIDPDHARELSHLWSKVQIPVPLEVVDAPDRNLLATVEETVAERVRPDTEVSVLLPKRSFSNFWNRILHDRTALGIFKVLGEMDNVNVTIVPFRLGRRGASVTPIGPSDGQPKRPVRAT